MPLKKVFANLESQMKKSLDFIHQEFATIHTGKASAALVEGILVEAYGQRMRLKELAGISVPDARMIVVSPWDATVTEAVHRAIQKSNIGLSPAVDGKIIRVRVPDLSEERRHDLDKVIKKIAEDGKVSVRNVRREANEEIKRLHKDKKVNEDEMFSNEKKVQEKTDEYIGEIDKLLAVKEKEILTV